MLFFSDGCKQDHPAFSNVTHMETVKEIVMNVKNVSIMADFVGHAVTTKQADTSGGFSPSGTIFLDIIMLYNLVFF